jgi:hypothetical protein
VLSIGFRNTCDEIKFGYVCFVEDMLFANIMSLLSKLMWPLC